LEASAEISTLLAEGSSMMPDTPSHWHHFETKYPAPFRLLRTI
jgi:hypothetical protein